MIRASRLHILTLSCLALLTALLVAFAPQAAIAQEAAPQEATAAAQAQDNAEQAAADPAAVADASSEDAVRDSAGSYTPMAPTKGKGMPMDGGIHFQDQYSKDGEYALWMHDYILLPVIAAISLFVLFLIMWVVVRYRRAANPTPSRTTHNTLLEVVWMLVPALILAVIAIPSISLLARQYEVPPKDAITIKATGYQWYWGYTYPDNGGFEVISNMMDEGEALANGEPPQLAVDNRMVVPVGVPIRLQTTGADVIHSFAVPSLWFKLDAVPGRLNERLLTIEEPGVYYGQCSELCGARHAYMPIAVEALPLDQFNAWVAAQGGTVAGAENEDDGPTEAELAPQQQPESAVPGAAGAGAPPTQDTAPTT